MKSHIRKFITFSLLGLFFTTGCASLVRDLFIDKEEIKIPQVVAHLKPFLKEGKIFILGEIVIENPTESDLELDKIYLQIKDSENKILEKVVLQWEEAWVKSKNEIKAPLKSKLDLSVLKREHVAVFLKTKVFYESLDIYLPIESKLAVLDFSLLKESIIRPLDLSIRSKLSSDITGKSSIDFSLEMSNPTEVDLLLKKCLVKIYTNDEKMVAKASLPQTLFKAGKKNQINGTIDLGNIFRTILTYNLFKLQPLKLEISGELIMLETGMSMPFSVETIQELDFSFDRNK